MVALLVAALPHPVFACSCGGLPGPEEADRYAAVFLGRVVMQSQGTLTMDRPMAWRGGFGRVDLALYGQGSSCEEVYKPGDWYLTYAYSEAGNPTLNTGYCHMVPSLFAVGDMISLSGGWERGALLLLGLLSLTALAGWFKGRQRKASV